MESGSQTNEVKKLYQLALTLALFTILYNLVEGVISTFFGFEDESLTLFGFGFDSFIEALSGLGIAHMMIRIRNNPNSKRDTFERTALRITGFAFYLLTTFLVITSVINVVQDHQPISTFWGVIISSISILVMWILFIWKRRVGRNLNSPAILADANCTLTCIYMSIILLLSSFIYEFFHIAYVDSVGSLGLAYFAFTEGKECFEKAKNEHIVC